MIADLSFRAKSPSSADTEDAIGAMLSALWRSGQILHGSGDWPPLVARGLSYSCRVRLPERNSLEPLARSATVRCALRRLKEAGILGPDVTIVGDETEGYAPDPCRKPKELLLFTHALDVWSPVVCLDHFQHIPLYRRWLGDIDVDRLRSWQGTYRALDRLNLDCGVGEAYATRQMSSLDSSLTREGIECRTDVESATGIPTYYYLYRRGGRSLSAELERRCPGCKEGWRLQKRHRFLDFKCVPCRLVSNLSFDFRPASTPQSHSTK